MSFMTTVYGEKALLEPRVNGSKRARTNPNRRNQKHSQEITGKRKRDIIVRKDRANGNRTKNKQGRS